MTPESDDVPNDERNLVLASPRRRLVLYHLSESGDELALEEASRKIAASEGGDIERTYEAVRQFDVPVLVEHGIVEFDEEKEVLRPAERLEEFVGALESRSGRLRRVLYYAVPAVVLAIVALAIKSVLGEHADSALSWVALAGAAALVLLTTFRYVRVRLPRSAP